MSVQRKTKTKQENQKVREGVYFIEPFKRCLIRASLIGGSFCKPTNETLTNDSDLVFL